MDSGEQLKTLTSPELIGPNDRFGLKAGDIALFVTSGTYSTDAKHAASGGDKFIRLIDGDEFIDMWQQ